jgi:hypothetical protein
VNIYKFGAMQALKELGFKRAELLSVDDEDDSIGDAFPSKSPSIPAERFAKAIQEGEENDQHKRSLPENAYHEFDRPVTWGSSINLAGLDQGQRMSGLHVPGNSRS